MKKRVNRFISLAENDTESRKSKKVDRGVKYMVKNDTDRTEYFGCRQGLCTIQQYNVKVECATWNAYGQTTITGLQHLEK